MLTWNPFRRRRLILEEVTTLKQEIRNMARTLDDTLAAVRAESTRIGSLITAFKGLQQQLKDAIPDPASQAKIDAIFDEATGEAGAIDMALTTDAAGQPAPAGNGVAGTVSDPGGTPADTGGATDPDASETATA